MTLIENLKRLKIKDIHVNAEGGGIVIQVENFIDMNTYHNISIDDIINAELEKVRT